MTAQRRPDQALPEAPACVAASGQSPARNWRGWRDPQLVGATSCRCCSIPRGQRWTARVDREGGRASWATGLGAAALFVFLSAVVKERMLNEYFRNSLQLHQALFKSASLVPWSCCAPYLGYHRSDFFLFLGVILRQSGVTFLNLCWHCAADKLSSTREAGKQRTKQLYKGM